MTVKSQLSQRRNEAPPAIRTRTHCPGPLAKSSTCIPESLKVIEKSSEGLRKLNPSSGPAPNRSLRLDACIAIPSQVRISLSPVPLLAHCMMTGIAESEDELTFASLAESYGLKVAAELADAMKLKAERTLKHLRTLRDKWKNRKCKAQVVTLIGM
jgi:hypothetical protein